jgi:hypothetical protein
MGLIGALVLANRKGFDLVSITWTALFCFLTLWGNYQSRYGVPLLPFQVTLTVQLLREFVQGSARWGWQRHVVATLVALSVARSLWVDWSLALPNDLFYF